MNQCITYVNVFNLILLFKDVLEKERDLLAQDLLLECFNSETKKIIQVSKYSRLKNANMELMS